MYPLALRPMIPNLSSKANDPMPETHVHSLLIAEDSETKMKVKSAAVETPLLIFSIRTSYRICQRWTIQG